MNHKTTSKITFHIWMTIVLTTVVGCGFEKYQAAPLKPSERMAEYVNHDPFSPEFKKLLSAQQLGESEYWGLDELTLCALQFNPALNVARAKWNAAVATQITAKQNPTPAISLQTDHHSQANGVSPWTLGLSISIPIEASGKKQARIDQAKSLSEAAQLEIGESAWQIKKQLTDSWNAYLYNQNQTLLLANQLAVRKDINALIAKRKTYGLASSTELSNANIQTQLLEQRYMQAANMQASLATALAGNAGLSPATFAKLHLKTPAIGDYLKAELAQNQLDTIKSNAQEIAVLNRLNLRAALARYDAAEAKVKLEIAKQYPDVWLSPSYSYDQGDKIWSLGIDTLLTFINKNRGQIQEAKALRELEAKQFDQLQSEVIVNINQSIEELVASNLLLINSHQLVLNNQAKHLKMQQQFKLGYIDKLELLNSQLELSITQEQALDAARNLYLAITKLEDAMQKPINQDKLTLNP